MTVAWNGLAWALGLLALVDAARAAARGGALARVERGLAPLRGIGRGDGADGGRQGLLVAAALCGAAGWLLAGFGGAALGCLLGAPAARVVGSWRRRRWRATVASQAPGASRALAAALRGGSSLPSALELAARDGALDPVGRELLGQAVRSMRLGARTEDALELLARRAGPGPWTALVAGMLVQREAGGDLARLLTELADELDLSSRAAAEARSASAQARLTARIVVALPVTGALLVELASPGAAAAIVGDPLALSLVVLALGLECVALLAVRRIARVGER